MHSLATNIIIANYVANTPIKKKNYLANTDLIHQAISLTHD